MAETTELLEALIPFHRTPHRHHTPRHHHTYTHTHTLTILESPTRRHLMDSCIPANDTVIYSPNIWVKQSCGWWGDVLINES